MSTQKTTLKIGGMSCASCVNHVEAGLRAAPGVRDVQVNLATERATVHFNPDETSRGQMEEAVRASGYEVSEEDDEDDEPSRGNESLRKRLGLALVFTIPIFLLEMIPMLIPGGMEWIMNLFPGATLLYVLFVLGSIVQFGPGRHFYRGGIASLRRGRPDMNALVMIGTSAAYGYSVVATFLPEVLPSGSVHVYYEAAATIITLILAGKYLESVAKGRASDAIRKLLDLRPATALVVRDDEEVEIPVSDVAPGDVIRVRPGGKVPVDGVVLKGASYVDESMISGEPVAVRKQHDDEVVGGTLNESGSFIFKATRVGADTVLAQIVKMVEDAQGSKPPIQSLADKVVGVFVPVVLGIAALTFAVWMLFGPPPALTFALVTAVSVLIIACPCAMGIATPISVMAGTGRAANIGIFVRDGAALQRLRDADVVALDKTGTLTKGLPEVTDVRVFPGFDERDVLRDVSAVEHMSEHPLGRSLVRRAELEEVEPVAVSDFEAVAGYGVKGVVSGRHVVVGAMRFMEKVGIDVRERELVAEAAPHPNSFPKGYNGRSDSGSSLIDEAASLADEGKTPIFAAIDGNLAAVFAVADPIKETTPMALEALHALGIRIAMITGDDARTAEAVARRLGIDEVEAGVLPGAKADAIRRLQGQGQTVAFVGDGINDAPALAQADVGMAIGTGTDVAIEAGDVVLMSGDLRGVPNAVALSKATLRNIKQNLFWAFAYNVALIPIAAGALYPAVGLLLSPALAAGAMVISDLFVISNAMRLRNWNPPRQRSLPSIHYVK